MSVRRYDIVRCNEGMHEYREIQERADGDYVSFEDYEQAVKERDTRIANIIHDYDRAMKPVDPPAQNSQTPTP